MSEPRTTTEYLTALNASLEIGLRSRRRIISEVADHLGQAVQEQLDGGAGPEEAQRRAITAFGSPAEVAARFEAGLAGALDRRLALGAWWLHRWAQRPGGFIVLGITLATVLAAVFAAVGASFGQNPLLAASGFLGAGIFWTLTLCAVTSSGRGLQSGMDERNAYALFLVPSVYSCLMVLGGVEDSLDGLTWLGYFVLVIALQAALDWAIEGDVERAGRRYAGSSEGDRRQAWRADHPCRAALSVVVPLPLGLAALVVVHPGPGDLRVALVGLIAAITALAVAAARLEQARREKDTYQHAYERAL